jgi:hypothetical protein
VLTDAAIRGAKDDLLAPAENIIIGHLPGRIRIYRYAEIELNRRRVTNRRRRAGREAAAAAPGPLVGALADDDL